MFLLSRWKTDLLPWFQICFAFNEDTLTIVDVTQHNRPQMVSRTEYRGAQYTHQVLWQENLEWYITH